jgi:ribosomal protein S16
MLTIRLKSEGKKHQKTMRIVVVDSKKSSISNKYIEKIG